MSIGKKMQQQHPVRWSKMIVFFLMMAFPDTAPADGLGPFYLPVVGLSEVFRETPAFVSPWDHEAGRIKLTMAARWLNVWAFHVEADGRYDWETDPENFPFAYGSFLMDMETISLTPRMSFKITETICLEASIPVIHQGGGILDGFIEGFHDAFGIDQNQRDNWERNGASMIYVAPDGDMIDMSDNLSGTFLGNVTLGGSLRVRDAGPALSVRVLCKFPTSNFKYGWRQNGIDTTLQAAASWQHNRIMGYHGAGITFYGSNGADELDLKARRVSLMNTLEYAFSDDFSLIAHLVAASASADYPKLDNPIFELTIGFKKRLGRGVLEFGLIENMFFFDNSPDGGFHAAYSMPIY